MFGWRQGTISDCIEFDDHQMCRWFSQQLKAELKWSEVNRVCVAAENGNHTWLIIGDYQVVSVPFGIIGEPQLRQSLIILPDFDYDTLIKEVSDVQKGFFELWNRTL